MLYYLFLRDIHKESKFMLKLPPGKHSCMGIGKTMPNPDKSIYIEKKLEVPLGPQILTNIDDTALLYNEYPFLLLKLNLTYLSYRFVFCVNTMFYY